ncbi:MAG: type II CAAX endopeptidase family protein [Opitutaceae bacterium]|nr:type II CAAX endopeptidase family protein [Opitutaceae bacterium]
MREHDNSTTPSEQPQDVASEQLSLAKPISKARWWAHLVLLASYPLAIGLMSFYAADSTEVSEAALSADPLDLLVQIAGQLGFFFVLFGLAWLASRATGKQLLLGWKGGIGPIWRGLAYSVGLRLAIGILAVCAVIAGMTLGGLDEETIQELRPKVEHTIDIEAIENSPLYLFINVTLVSFVFAGLREELWRAGVLAGLAALFPRLFESVMGKLAAVAMVAIIFGLGHFSQGWGGVALTTGLGVGLGAIMVFHRSIWDAVFAHGFFNASSFILMHLLVKFFPEYSPF